MLQNISINCITQQKRSWLIMLSYSYLFRSKEWVVPCRRENFDKKEAEYLYKNLRICAKHFEDIMFSNDLENRHNP